MVSDRLKKVGERVGLPAHARSDAFVQLAEPMAELREIENGNVLAAGAASLYLPAGAYTALSLQIITHWSVATGRNVKDPTLRARTPGLLAATAGPTPVGLGSPRAGEVVPIGR